MMNTTRQPAVQGKFYGGTRQSISDMMELLDRSAGSNPGIPPDCTLIGAVLPHAGHVYSGYQTVPFFRLLRDREITPDTWVIIHPDHRGAGPAVALDGHTAWETALGKVPLDLELMEHLRFERNANALASEHSGEVILPYIQYYFPGGDFKIMPVSMGDQSATTAAKLASEIRRAMDATGRNVMLIASSDFSHFLSAEEGYRKDQLVLDRIADRDIAGVEQVVRKERISVCGYGPIMTLMAYAENADSDYQNHVLARGHSGDVSPSAEVVDYISMVFYSE